MRQRSVSNLEGLKITKAIDMDAATLERMITIREDATGMFFATCEDEPSFFVAQTSRESLDKLIPGALERVVREHSKRDMVAAHRDAVDSSHLKVRLYSREALEHAVA
jgi:hypothetical protein